MEASNSENLNSNINEKKQHIPGIDKILSGYTELKKSVSDINSEIKNANFNQMKSDISSLKKEVVEIKNLLLSLIQNKQQILLPSSINQNININNPQKNLINNININKPIINNQNDNKLDNKANILNIPNNKLVIISMNGKDIQINIKLNITLVQFKSIVKNYFIINDNINIFYFNNFGIKKFILNESDFKNSFNQNTLKYYFSDDTIIINHKQNLNNNNNSNSNKNKISIIYPNNLIETKISKEKNMELYKQHLKDVISHFASMALIPGNIDKGDFINSAVSLSYIIKKINIQEKQIFPGKFLDSKAILKYPGLISYSFSEKEKLFILSLLSIILEEKGINVTLCKNSDDSSDINNAFLQYLFNGFTEKKKYEIEFELENAEKTILLKKGEELNNFIDKWKTKISNHLKIDKSEIFLVNPKDNNGFFLDLVTNEGSINYNKIKNFNEIKNIEEKALLEGFQLNTDIFEPCFNNHDPGWGWNVDIGIEQYIPPLGWYGFGLKVSKKYDNGDDTWLDYVDREGTFVTAYLGLSNVYGNKKNLNLFLNEINSQEVLKMGYEQTYKNDINIKIKSLKEYPKCGNGIYLYQDPKIAENAASIIDIGGVRYKILLMCRVNPYKIRQPKGYKGCWILNPTPSEVRPYRILIKKIFRSPMSEASQNEIKIFPSSPDYYKDIIKQKDTSFLSKNLTKYNNDDYIINLYTSKDYCYINNYLRDGKINDELKYKEKEIKSFIYCLHHSLTNRKSNVLNGSIYYRGVNRKFKNDLKIGSKFIFPEFISVSEDKDLALNFAYGGTLFIIRIENNNYPKYYCYNIQKISHYSSEREILITSNCTFQITQKNYNNKGLFGEVYLACEGYAINDSLDDNKNS